MSNYPEQRSPAIIERVLKEKTCKNMEEE